MVEDEPEVEVRYLEVRDLSVRGVDARGYCLACERDMLRAVEARKGILWLKCPACEGVTCLAHLLLVREAQRAQEDPEHRSRLCLFANPPRFLPTFRAPKSP